MSTQTLEWFSSLVEVPGVDWCSPEGFAPDPRLASARPVTNPHGYSELTAITWVDRDGRPIADEYMSSRSPAELALENRFEIGDPKEAIWVMCHALALPGTRYDYHTALSWLPDVVGVPGAWAERALRADVQLVLADPAAAVASPWAEDSDMLPEAGRPILRLMDLYVREGFLVEAADTERLLDRLPEAARIREYSSRLAEIAEALRSLQA